MKVLIALDDSPVSSRAARVAARLFTGDDVEFLVINVATVAMPWVGMGGYGMVTPLAMDPRWLEPDEDAEADLMARAEAAGVPDPVPVVSTGDPVTLICAAAEEHGVDVIVVGSHDKTALRRLFDPSVAAGVVRDTYRPVLVVSGAPPSG
ncbi:MAG TPA: universal stress protein [Acidimicrobiales bacterium]|nr:universal stress protein [Acidimicrobiales bacterium]